MTGLTEFKKIEDIIQPLYNDSITNFHMLNNKPRIYFIEFIAIRLGCEKREDGCWYGVTGKEKKTRELIKNTLDDMGYEIIHRSYYGPLSSIDGYHQEIHIIKEMER